MATQILDLQQAERIAANRFGVSQTSARLESLQTLQDAYEDWKRSRGVVSVVDLFWSWTIDNA